MPIDISSLRIEVRSLIDIINHHNYLYHALDQPKIPDSEYDALYSKLKEFEKRLSISESLYKIKPNIS